MKGLKIYSENEVKQDVKKLCDLNAVCGCGIKYYTIDIKDVKKYVINENNRTYSSNELEAIYNILIIEQKVIKEVIKNIPDINIEFDEWDYVNRAKYGIYENDSLELEVKNNLVTIDLKVSEKYDNSFEDFNSECCHTKGELNIEINSITIENENFGTINILDRYYLKLINAIIKNINI